MTTKIIAAIFLLSFGQALSQYETIYIASNPNDLAYGKTRNEMLDNYLNNRPLLNYVPVYNTEYGLWEGERQKQQDFQQPIKKSQVMCPEVDFDKFGEVINRLQSNMQSLGHKTKHIYEGKLKELGEVKKLHDNLRSALQNTDALKNNLHQNQKQLIELAKNPRNPTGYPFVNPEGVDQFLKAIEGLESMVRNINYKCDGKPGM